jgi:hypothetical protein
LWISAGTQNRKEVLNFDLKILGKQELSRMWRPFIELLSSKNSSSGKILYGREGLMRQKMVLTFGDIKKVRTASSLGFAKEWQIYLRSGVQKKSDSKVKIYSSKKIFYKFRTASSFSNRAVTIRFNSLQGGRSAALLQEGSAADSRLRSSVTIFNQQLFQLLLEKVKSKNFSISSQDFSTRSEVFMIKNGVLMAAVHGKLGTSDLTNLRFASRADLVYRGRSDSMFVVRDSQTKNVANLQRWLRQSQSRGGGVYIMRGGQLFPMSRNFMKTASQLKRFVGADAPYLFSSKVDIIYHK